MKIEFEITEEEIKQIYSSFSLDSYTVGEWRLLAKKAILRQLFVDYSCLQKRKELNNVN